MIQRVWTVRNQAVTVKNKHGVVLVLLEDAAANYLHVLNPLDAVKQTFVAAIL